MTLTRLFSPAARASLLIVAGSALITLPFVVGLSISAAVTGIVVGVLAVALGLAGTAGSGRGTLPVSAQATYDRGLGVGLILAGAVFGLDGEPGAMAFFAATGVATLLVTTVTRYTAVPG